MAETSPKQIGSTRHSESKPQHIEIIMGPSRSGSSPNPEIVVFRSNEFKKYGSQVRSPSHFGLGYHESSFRENVARSVECGQESFKERLMSINFRRVVLDSTHHAKETSRDRFTMMETAANSSILTADVLVTAPGTGTRCSENAGRYVLEFIYGMNGWQFAATILAILVAYDQRMSIVPSMISTVD